jgi:hypothetical protein
VATVVVVVLEPWSEGCGPVVVAREDVPVGPFGLQCSVEPFDLAVLPWAVRLDEHVLRGELGQGSGEVVAAGVVPGVVGHHRLDVIDAELGEVDDRSLEEASRGGRLFVGEDL